MALLTLSGELASQFEEAGHGAAQLLGFDLVTEAKLSQLLTEEFGETEIAGRAWRPAVASILARLATEHHLVAAIPGAESLFDGLPFPASILLRARVIAPLARRIGNLMLERRLERDQARALLADGDGEARRQNKSRFGRSAPHMDAFDVILNAARMDPEQMAEVLRSTAAARGIATQGLLPAGAEAEIQFHTRLHLARHGIVPAGRAHLKRAAFGHPSEALFANLLDFYRIQWDYEPRSFPLQWDKDGNVTEAFTPDFYLPEFDLYVELTTMKQALVTRKNHKVKLLRAVYPHVNIQVFYQKDFQDLVFKYGLRMSAP